MPRKKSELLVKRQIIAIGLAGAGKTSFLKKQLSKSSTIIANPVHITTDLQDSRIWDVGGNPRYDIMQSLYHQNAKTALLFIDCSRVNKSIENLRSKVKKLPTDIRYGVVFTKRDLAPNLDIAESFEKVKEQLNLSSKPFVSSKPYVSTSLHDNETSLDRKLKELIESEARAFKKIETALTSLEKHRDKKIKKNDSKYDKVTSFIQDTRQRINDFNSGNNQAFAGYQKHHQGMIKDLKDNRTTAKWWRAIAINFATLGVSLICTRISTKKTTKSYLPFYSESLATSGTKAMKVESQIAALTA
ncbi:hypothetical protein Psal071_01928 [Piscirickettsia salmonis]|uniref:Uncharacterized protein n=1 Tax=Piscirickettsia salmonis TaxID=1238 RepID=A0A9Q6LLQ6_PISSA|nr:Rab family GTPase [Piscirickettsia salmonis]QGN94780.1 hypothetical protein Psal006a_01381 [Piscirickettsia salmonis]QGO06269.1 hypothetical protein Psal009_02177 [Piscirickettsia salmonis]QGO34595.1 hypothetical protein Psal028_01928 [Piscirickettsia salmonis]QGO38211.1 hypothetical protein Psal040_01933 [Piscirickettsia salmonis]QGO41828.1 hypothetical protein Psal041_01925 [Piscirickettsia salmonis]